LSGEQILILVVAACLADGGADPSFATGLPTVLLGREDVKLQWQTVDVIIRRGTSPAWIDTGTGRAPRSKGPG